MREYECLRKFVRNLLGVTLEGDAQVLLMPNIVFDMLSPGYSLGGVESYTMLPGLQMA